MSADGGRMQCPFCDEYGVERMYMASLRIDSCICNACGARWDEDTLTGEFRGRQSQSRTSRSAT